jgi:hypothetical protein
VDIYCGKCGEPWEVDSLHTMVEDGLAANFNSARKSFYAYGCGAFDSPQEPCTHAPVASKTKIHAYSALQDLMGEDIDGLASLCDDANFYLT